LACIKTFLSDYGLVWVGDGDCEAPERMVGPSALRASAKSASSTTQQLPINVQSLQIALDELNALVEDGRSQVVRGACGEYRLRSPQAVHLTVWRDGVQCHRSSFRKWKETQCMAFVRDIFDGARRCVWPLSALRSWPC